MDKNIFIKVIYSVRVAIKSLEQVLKRFISRWAE